MRCCCVVADNECDFSIRDDDHLRCLVLGRRWKCRVSVCVTVVYKVSVIAAEKSAKWTFWSLGDAKFGEEPGDKT